MSPKVLFQSVSYGLENLSLSIEIFSSDLRAKIYLVHVQVTSIGKTQLKVVGMEDDLSSWSYRGNFGS